MTRQDNRIEVKVARIGDVTKEVNLEINSTVEQALELADVMVDATDEIQVNGAVADETKVLANGDKIVIIPKVDGGAF